MPGVDGAGQQRSVCDVCHQSSASDALFIMSVCYEMTIFRDCGCRCMLAYRLTAILVVVTHRKLDTALVREVVVLTLLHHDSCGQLPGFAAR